MLLAQLYRALMKPSGPRRDEAEKVADDLTHAKRANRISVLKNKIAVQELLDETLARVERQHGPSEAHQ